MGTKYKNIINPNKLIPKSFVITSADTHLYRIGLSLFNTNGIKRKLIYNPVIIFIISFQLLLRNLIFMFMSNDKYQDSLFHLYLGNFTYLVTNRNELAIMPCSIIMISICSQIMNWNNYRNGIQPVDNIVFKMMSGLITPKSIGINDGIMCYKLLIISRNGFIAAKYVSNSVFFLINSMIISIIYPLITNNISILISIINALSWSISCHYIYAIIVYQTVYYYIITYYLKIKLNLLNEKLKSIIKSNKYLRYSKVIIIIRDYYKIHSEINEYNSNYWSIFLSLIWLNITIIISIIVAFNDIFR